MKTETIETVKQDRTIYDDADRCDAPVQAFDRGRCEGEDGSGADDADAADDADDADDSGSDEGKPKVFTLTEQALTKRIQRATRAGQEGLVKALGFESMDALKARLTPEKKPDEKKDEGPKPLTREEMLALLDERDQKAAAREQERKDAEATARRLTKAGVVEAHLPTVQALLKAHLATLDEDDRDEFNPVTWTKALLKQHPSFGAVREDKADTGKNGNDKPPPDKGKGDKFNAVTATPEEIARRRAEIRRSAASKGI